MSQEDLELLNKEELVRIILEQAQQLAQLKADYEALKQKMDRHSKPPTTSKNSSQPPSKDQKNNQTPGQHRQKHGPPTGHRKHARKIVEQADQVVNLRAKSCCMCQADLSTAEGRLVKVNQITEVPEARAQVIEVRGYETTCPHCGQVQAEEAPAGLEMGRTFGARLEATVVYYRQEQHMSYKRTQQALLDLHGVIISQGGIDDIMKRAGDKAVQGATSIEEEVRQSAVIHSDETSSRVKGDNWWEWVFCTAQAVLHVIRFNRSVDVIQDVMTTARAEVWVSDCYSAQIKAPAEHLQLCLAHQLRNLQAVVDANPTLTWPRAMQMLFRYAIHLHHQRHQLSPDQFASEVARVNRHCDRLLLRILAPPDAKRLLRRYHKHRQNLFVFLDRTDVEPTNNKTERALRSSVVRRKIIGCFRSDLGSKSLCCSCLSHRYG